MPSIMREVILHLYSVRSLLEYSVTSLGLSNGRDMWTYWSRVSSVEGKQDGCVAGAWDVMRT